jgi:uncharacterized protein
MTEMRIGNYMHTFTGRKYWPFDPRVEEVFIEDIAHSLANKCRYAGHCTKFYSVAEHSVYCSCIGPEDEALERLLHDASEAYNGDLIRPLKRMPEFAEPFRIVEEKNERIIADRFKLVYPYPPSVKFADEAVTAREVEDIINKDPNLDFSLVLHDRTNIADITIKCLPPELAKAAFLDRFAQLWIERK